MPKITLIEGMGKIRTKKGVVKSRKLVHYSGSGFDTHFTNKLLQTIPKNRAKYIVETNRKAK